MSSTICSSPRPASRFSSGRCIRWRWNSSLVRRFPSARPSSTPRPAPCLRRLHLPCRSASVSPGNVAIFTGLRSASSWPWHRHCRRDRRGCFYEGGHVLALFSALASASLPRWRACSNFTSARRGKRWFRGGSRPPVPAAGFGWGTAMAHLRCRASSSSASPRQRSMRSASPI